MEFFHRLHVKFFLIDSKQQQLPLQSLRNGNFMSYTAEIKLVASHIHSLIKAALAIKGIIFMNHY